MRHLFSVVFAAAILIGAYVVNFGVPARISQAIPFLNSAGSDAETADAHTTNQRARGGRTTSVVLESLAYRPYTATIEAIGNATSWRSADVLAETSGRVTEVAMKPNLSVEEGDVLVRLDDRTQELNLNLARAEMAQAKTDFDRLNQLRNNGNLTVTAVSLADFLLEQTRAEAAVGLAEVELDKRTIRAPFKGKLGLNRIEVGNLINASDIIVSIDDTETLLVEFELPERSISMLELGRAVLASTPSYAGRVFQAEITAYDSRIDSTTRTVSVEARIDNSDGLLWSGMTFAVRLLNDTEPMPSVPATALNWARHGAGIWVVEDGKARREPITVRFRRGGDVWIDTELPEGTTIVVEGAAKLREGSAVEGVGQNESARAQSTQRDTALAEDAAKAPT
ncbi:efflux RND transporter periplasmic adaptor subunit [Rhodobacteraceae bacterium]|nr:efflux RND transporter periplasmic adaptor subunit [Paracoccaceae bacterium]